MASKPADSAIVDASGHLLEVELRLWRRFVGAHAAVDFLEDGVGGEEVKVRKAQPAPVLDADELAEALKDDALVDVLDALLDVAPDEAAIELVLAPEPPADAEPVADPVAPDPPAGPAPAGTITTSPHASRQSGRERADNGRMAPKLSGPWH